MLYWREPSKNIETLRSDERKTYRYSSPNRFHSIFNIYRRYRNHNGLVVVGGHVGQHLHKDYDSVKIL
jgi:hypothetical protein